MIGNYLKVSAEQIEDFVNDPSRAEELAFPDDGDDPPDALDIDKTWHLIHFLLTGKAWGGKGPLSRAVLGGHELPGTNAGYGPFRYLRPKEVSSTAAALAEVTPEALWARFDRKKVRAAEIYPSPWDGDKDDKAYVLHHFEALERFFSEASSASRGMLLYLS